MLTAGGVIEAARLSHPALTRQMVPSSVSLRLVTQVQRRLLLLCHQRNPDYLTTPFVIALEEGDVASLGAGLPGGAPLVQGTTTLERSATNAGALATADPSATVLQGEIPVVTAGPLSLTATAVWAVDAFLGMEVVITAGPGEGQRRIIASNTADTLALEPDADDGGGPWATLPTAASMFLIRQPLSEADGEVAVTLGALPTEGVKQGWLVRLRADGTPYLDLAQPVLVPFTDGIPLPPNYHINPVGICRLRRGNDATQEQVPFAVTFNASRLAPGAPWSGTVAGEKLFLAAPYGQWRNVAAIELSYLALPPAVARAGDPLMLPDAAEEAMIAGVGAGMALRLHALDAVGGQRVYNEVQARAAEFEALWVAHVGGAGRAVAGYVQEVW